MLLGILTIQVSAGELGHEPKKLEDQLSHISQLAYHWKALVLMDEADVFVQARSIDSHQNARVSVFLRKLEYNQGIMFLFDDAIQSRITLAVRYEPLSLATRKQVWASFLKKAVTANGAAKYNPEDLDGLARKDLNGRQVRAPGSSRIPSNLLILTESFIVDQKHSRRGPCVSCVSQHQGVYVSIRIGH